MESYAHKNTTLELFKTLFTETEFRDWPHAGIVIQAYLRDAEKDLLDLIEWGRARGTRFTVRLVKGAYWDYEKIKSTPERLERFRFICKSRRATQISKRSRAFLLENESIVTAAFGSHNVRSIAHAQALADELGIDRSRFEFQLLYGMAGPIKRALVEMGYRVREYCPVGELLARDVVSRSALAREHFQRRIFAREIFRERFRRAIVARSERTLPVGEMARRISKHPAKINIRATALPLTRRPATLTKTRRS